MLEALPVAVLMDVLLMLLHKRLLALVEYEFDERNNQRHDQPANQDEKNAGNIAERQLVAGRFLFVAEVAVGVLEPPFIVQFS